MEDACLETMDERLVEKAADMLELSSTSHSTP